MKCCFCDKEINGYGNDARPVAGGKCCDLCNINIVLPARLSMLMSEQEYTVAIGDAIKIIDINNGSSSINDNIRYKGLEGTVTHFDDIGQIFGTWGGIALIPENDTFFVKNKGLFSKGEFLAE